MAAADLSTRCRVAHLDGPGSFHHIENVVASVGGRVGTIGCHPNFFFIVTDEPESVLRGAWKRNWHLFGDASPTLVNEFIHTPRPVRVWYNNILAGEDGPAVGAASVAALASDPMLPGSPLAGVPAIVSDGNQIRARFTTMNDLLAVVAIIDPTQVQGYTWAQVVDYVAMTGLTRISANVDVGDAPSILRLFTVDAVSRPAALSDWDRTFLQELYGTDPLWRGQRLAVSHNMVRDLQSETP